MGIQMASNVHAGAAIYYTVSFSILGIQITSNVHVQLLQ